ncbi:MAG: T9SS type A sorting domain-containing protein [Bacteroidetes bacterium]|nr:T9SS type A sorting domain-containing protein [Bacteroidota bacterium]
MKKIYALFSILFYCSFCVAQIEPSVLHPKKQIVYDKSKFVKLNNAAAKVSTISNQGWFNYGASAELFYNSYSQIHGSYLFPDSLGYMEYVSGIFMPCWVHHIAELVDFKSPIFSLDPSTNWVANSGVTNYYIDSISIVYAYTRANININIVDTLIFTIYDNTISTNMSLSAPVTGAIANNFSADTIAFQLLGYNPSNNIICAPSPTTGVQVSPSGAYILKVLLTEADTSVYFKEKKIGLPTPFISSAGKFAVADVMFKPGYSYYPGEYITQTQNSFLFASRKENEDINPIYMNHIDCNYGSSLCDNSMSYILTTDTRYNTPAGYNYRYSPTFSFNGSYFLEHHLISFHLTDTLPAACQVNSQFSVFADSLTPGNYFAYNNSTGSGTLSYLWNFGDGTTSTQPYPFHQYAVPGQYVICLDVTASSGTTTCTDTYCDSSSVQKMASGFLMSQFNVISPTVTQITQTETINDIKIYPNPVDEQLNIEFSANNSQKSSYILFDALGRIVLTGNLNNSKTTINTSNLEKGFYSLSVTNEKGSSLKTIKLVK